MSNLFDDLLKYEGEDFRRGVVAALNLLYNLNLRTGRSHNDDISRLKNIIVDTQTAAENLNAKVQEIDAKWMAMLENARGGPSN